MRSNCKECPYKVKSEHNSRFPSYVDKMFKLGRLESKEHTCHMVGNVWDKPTEKSVCVGSRKLL